MLERLRIGTRLAIGFGSLIAASTVAFLACAAIGLQGQAAIVKADEDQAHHVQLVHSMREAQLQIVSSIRSAGLQTDGGQVNKDHDAYKAALKALVQHEGELAALPIGADERALIEQAVALRKKAEPLAAEAIKYTMAFAGEQAAKVLTEQFAPVEKQWAEVLVQLASRQAERARVAKDEIATANRSRLGLLAGLLATVIVGGGLFAVTMTRSVTRPLREAAQVASEVAEGNLAIRIEPRGQDEAADLLRSLASMAQQLAGMVSAVRSSAESIDVASREISQGNHDLSHRTESQAASVQQTSATLQELTGMVNRNADNAQTVRGLADRTAEVADRGGRAMGSVSTTMSLISDSSRRISEIIGVIDGIAFQTNILALNAAVEAARAGEQGRGFAVVASEVRALAQRVSTAAAEVRTLINESVERVDDGSRQVTEMNSTIKDLTDSVERVRTLVGEITDASSRQSQNIVQLNSAMHSIDTTTQQNSALVEQVAAAAQSLSGQTEQLTGMVRRFRVAGA
ncbi:MAG: methyl-accepting chemotaxis protein [Rubrivivax sp.]